MYTANTMSSAIEAMGMSLPYSSSVPAEDPLKKLECRLAGRQVLLLLVLVLILLLVLLLLQLLLLSLLLSLMMHDVPLLEADRQTLRSQWPYFQHLSADCAEFACAHHGNGYQVTKI